MDNQLSIGVLKEFRIEFLDCWQRLPNKDLSSGFPHTLSGSCCVPIRISVHVAGLAGPHDCESAMPNYLRI
jgi:hypothetical protein